jgi:hypothetical protein
MEYILLAGAAAVGAGIYYLFRARDDVQQVAPRYPRYDGRQAQAGLSQRARPESEDVPVDFEKYRVSQLMK